MAESNFQDFLCEKFFEKVVKNIEREKNFCENSENFCNYGTTLVKREHVLQRLPNECLECTREHRFGQRRRVISKQSTNEVIFIIGCDLETDASARGLKRGLIRFGNQMKREFNKSQIITEFKVLFAEKYSDFWPNFDQKLSRSLSRTLTRVSANISHSFDFLLKMPRVTRPVNRHVVAVECRPMSDESESHVDFVAARNHFL